MSIIGLKNGDMTRVTLQAEKEFSSARKLVTLAHFWLLFENTVRLLLTRHSKTSLWSRVQNSGSVNVRFDALHPKLRDCILTYCNNIHT